MDQVQHAERLCNAIMALIAPELHDGGLKAIEYIKQGREVANPHANQQLWPSIFSGISVIVNRVTRPHRDSGGSSTHYDLLVSAGTHEQARLVVRELGVHLSYRPGDVVALCGKLFLHEVREWLGGERVCVAHYMKDKVHERLHVPRPTWPMEQNYLSLVGK
jgi:hypothetical protein